MHGAVKTPTFVRLAKEPLAGQTTLTIEQPATAWKAGDRIVIPDTRQLRESQRGDREWLLKSQRRNSLLLQCVKFALRATV